MLHDGQKISCLLSPQKDDVYLTSAFTPKKHILIIESIYLQFSFCFWMATVDKDNYCTVVSYAVEEEDNEITFTDYSGFVLAVRGKSNLCYIAPCHGVFLAIRLSQQKEALKITVINKLYLFNVFIIASLFLIKYRYSY